MKKILLVGFGEMGKNCHFNFLKNQNDINIVGIVRSKNQLIPGYQIYNSLEIALQDTQPDIALISTPHYLHFKQAKMCLEYKCHVLVEKPAALKYEDVVQLNRLASIKDKIIVEGLQRRYETMSFAFREVQKTDKIGDIKFIHGLFAHKFGNTEDGNWRQNTDLAGMGLIDDSAIHLIDLLVYFTGMEPLNIHSKVMRDDQEFPHTFTCFFNTENNTVVSASGSILSPVNSVQEEISVWGTKGSLFLRRFKKERDTNAPLILFQTADGSKYIDFRANEIPMGKHLPLLTLLDVIDGKTDRSQLYSELKNTLYSHKVLAHLRGEIQ